jgi:3-isopropylmalate/(R)-2-methylmalate dehydratase large subunit
MGMTITEKILADHTSHEMVSPGDMIEAQVDLAFGNDITAPIAIQLLQENQIEKLFDPDKILVMSDHFTPNKDIISATNARFRAKVPGSPYRGRAGWY